MPGLTNGREAVKAKGIAGRAMIEIMYAYKVGEPIVPGEFFRDGKIVKEQFFN